MNGKVKEIGDSPPLLFSPGGFGGGGGGGGGCSLMGHFLQSERKNGARGKELKKEKGGGGDGPGFNRKRGKVR